MRRRVETDEGSRMERGVDSILRLFRVFFFTLARTVSSNFLFFFSNFLTTNERAVDAVVYPRPRTKAARNLRVAASHTFRVLFSFPSLYVRLYSPRYLGKLGKAGLMNFNSTLYICFHQARPTLRFFSARGKDESRGATIKSKSLDFTSSSFFSLGKENSSLEDWKRKGRRRERERERFRAVFVLARKDLRASSFSFGSLVADARRVHVRIERV